MIYVSGTIIILSFVSAAVILAINGHLWISALALFCAVSVSINSKSDKEPKPKENACEKPSPDSSKKSET